MHCFSDCWELNKCTRCSLIVKHNDMWNMSDNEPTKDSRSLTQQRSVSHLWKQANDRFSPGLIDRGLTQSCQSNELHLPPSFHPSPALQGHLIDPEHGIRPSVFFFLLIALFIRSLLICLLRSGSGGRKNGTGEGDERRKELADMKGCWSFNKGFGFQ